MNKHRIESIKRRKTKRRNYRKKTERTTHFLNGIMGYRKTPVSVNIFPIIDFDDFLSKGRACDNRVKAGTRSE